jgi:hypothetical protein
MAYPKAIKAKEKRKQELLREELDKKITIYYFQKSEVGHYRELTYASGRKVRVDKSNQTS